MLRSPKQEEKLVPGMPTRKLTSVSSEFVPSFMIHASSDPTATTLFYLTITFAQAPHNEEDSKAME